MLNLILEKRPTQKNARIFVNRQRLLCKQLKILFIFPGYEKYNLFVYHDYLQTNSIVNPYRYVLFEHMVFLEKAFLHIPASLARFCTNLDESNHDTYDDRLQTVSMSPSQSSTVHFIFELTFKQTYKVQFLISLSF